MFLAVRDSWFRSGELQLLTEWRQAYQASFLCWKTFVSARSKECYFSSSCRYSVRPQRSSLSGRQTSSFPLSFQLTIPALWFSSCHHSFFDQICYFGRYTAALTCYWSSQTVWLLQIYCLRVSTAARSINRHYHRQHRRNYFLQHHLTSHLL